MNLALSGMTAPGLSVICSDNGFDFGLPGFQVSSGSSNRWISVHSVNDVCTHHTQLIPEALQRMLASGGFWNLVDGFWRQVLALSRQS